MNKNRMKARRACLAALWILPLPFSAQAPSVIPMDQEPHHHLVVKNDIVKVFEIDLAPRDAMSMHRHDHDEVSIAVGDATTVSTTPGKADILTISKPGDVNFTRGGWEHSLRNIGQTAFHSISIDLIRDQAGARNLCGTQIPDLPANCPAATVDTNAPRVDLPQFETDQMRVTLKNNGDNEVRIVTVSFKP